VASQNCCDNNIFLCYDLDVVKNLECLIFMESELKIQGRTIKYIFNRHRRFRRLRLTIRRDATVRVSAPLYISQKIALHFINEHADWILKKHDYFKNLPVPVLDDGSEYKRYKIQAEELVKNRIKILNKNYGFKLRRFSIRNQSTRWGSCSRLKNLNFNYRLIFLPPELSDYIIVHELCHLGEMNHSAKFWQLVAQEKPDYLALRRELKKINLSII